MRGNGDTLQIVGEGLRPAQSGLSDKAPPNIKIRRGAVIRVAKTPKNTWEITQLPEVEGAFIALDPRDGAVKAMVGGFDFDKNKFNHVTQAWRQPGSSFKPFIYSAALEKGFTPATVVNDAPLFFDAGTTGGQPWEPKNYDGNFEGPMSLRRALAKSKNMVSIRVLQSIGTRYAQDWIGNFGFEREKHPAYLPMALGAGSVTPMQMATALLGVRQRRLPRQSLSRDAHHRPQGQGAGRRAAAAAQRNACAPSRSATPSSWTACCRRWRAAARPPRRRPRSSAPTSTARPAPPTIRWTPGSPASSRRWPRWPGWATTRRASWATARPAAA